MDAATPRFASFALDCREPLKLAGFYAELLGCRVSPGSDEEWADVIGDGPTLSFQRVADHMPPEWPEGRPQQAHIDFVVDDIVAAHERVLALGARALDPVEPPVLGQERRGYRVYADPAGHPFCLCRPRLDAWG
jgi:catechol 2,3-dioxygenase-like lactoylglutathione lyase family enzyme